MRTRIIVIIALCATCCSCSPRDILTRRLARDLIAMSPAFRAPQQFQLRTGVIGNAEYLTPQYLALQHHGWIVGSITPCPPEVTPPPCWEVAMTPLGVDTFRDLIHGTETGKEYFSIPTARRELVAITGISKSDNTAEVEFTWRWTPMNEVGSALNTGGLQYRSTVTMRHYDDGWRLIEGAMRPNQSLDDALKNADPISQ